MAYKNKSALNAYQAARQRKRTAEEDYMANLLKMGLPSSVMELVDSIHPCMIAMCYRKTVVMLTWPHWEPVTLCARHDRMRRAKRTK